MTALVAGADAGLVDIVVVYRVDRLTRSLADFAKIGETRGIWGAGSCVSAARTAVPAGLAAAIPRVRSAPGFQRRIVGLFGGAVSPTTTRQYDVFAIFAGVPVSARMCTPVLARSEM